MGGKSIWPRLFLVGAFLGMLTSLYAAAGQSRQNPENRVRAKAKRPVKAAKTAYHIQVVKPKLRVDHKIQFVKPNSGVEYKIQVIPPKPAEGPLPRD